VELNASLLLPKHRTDVINKPYLRSLEKILQQKSWAYITEVTGEGYGI
jgi:hypothetical protein